MAGPGAGEHFEAGSGDRVGDGPSSVGWGEQILLACDDERRGGDPAEPGERVVGQVGVPLLDDGGHLLLRGREQRLERCHRGPELPGGEELAGVGEAQRGEGDVAVPGAAIASLIQSTCCSIETMTLLNTAGLPGPVTRNRLGNPAVARPR